MELKHVSYNLGFSIVSYVNIKCFKRQKHVIKKRISFDCITLHMLSAFHYLYRKIVKEDFKGIRRIYFLVIKYKLNSNENRHGIRFIFVLKGVSKARKYFINLNTKIFSFESFQNRMKFTTKFS